MNLTYSETVIDISILLNVQQSEIPSSHPCLDKYSIDLTIDIYIFLQTLEVACRRFMVTIDWLEEQERDPILQRVREWYAEGKAPPARELYREAYELRAWAAQFDGLTMVNGLLGRWWTGPRGRNYFQLAVPKAQRPQTLHQVHGAPLAGHVARTFKLFNMAT